MENPRPEKVAVVDEVKERLSAADATILTDYRGIDVPGMAELRRALREAGGDVKIYKNTLVRFAARDLGLEIEDLLAGPTALTFITEGDEGTGDPVLVAKALRDFAKSNESLEVKGGLLGDRLLTAEEVAQLARIAPREELLAKLAGGLAAPMQQLAGLLQALPRDLAYGLRALIDQGGGPEAAAAESDAGEATEEPTDVAGAEASGAAEAEAAAEEADTSAAEDAPEAAGDENAEDTAPADASDEASDDSDDSDSEEG